MGTFVDPRTACTPLPNRCMPLRLFWYAVVILRRFKAPGVPQGKFLPHCLHAWNASALLKQPHSACQTVICSSTGLTSGLHALLDDIVGDGGHGLCHHVQDGEAFARLHNRPLALGRLLCRATDTLLRFFLQTSLNYCRCVRASGCGSLNSAGALSLSQNAATLLPTPLFLASPSSEHHKLC